MDMKINTANVTTKYNRI